MRRFAMLVLVGLALAVTGCGDSHEKVMKDQLKIREQLVEVLKKVNEKDKASMEAAAPKVSALAKEYAAVNEREKKLGQPTAEEFKKMLENAQKDGFKGADVGMQLSRELMRFEGNSNVPDTMR